MLLSVLPIMLYNPIVPVFIIMGLSDIRSQPGVIYTYAEPGMNIIHIVLILLSFVFLWLYGSLSMVMLKDRTIGMRLMNIKVIKRDGSNMRPLDAFIRQFAGKVLLAGLTWNIS